MDSLTALSPSSIAAVGAATVVAYGVGKCVYNVFFHPLRHIPGPWYAAASPAWLAFQDILFVKGKSIAGMDANFRVPDVTAIVSHFDRGAIQAVW